ncbi:hypothetical protein NM208_g13090 [Fusarium decemcellulare]|uniref:Uncharacterized protein n=1 Tax=Fusarium decemcellulare TaxID=57161 RepID=A0ACC1RN11_9HYPO|nr:hypothetical protein NM208_g13090 [Fusarium decemcellulare]
MQVLKPIQLEIEGPESTGATPWSKWYRPGSEDDIEIYASALRKCKEVNDQLQTQPRRDDEIASVASNIIQSSPIRLRKARVYDAAWVEALIEKKKQELQDKKTATPEWREKMSTLVEKTIKLTTELKPIIDIFVPKSPEYSGVLTIKDKKGTVMEILHLLSDEIPTIQAYKDLFPTDEMKHALAEVYIHTVDLLGGLANYASDKWTKQLLDAVLPRTKYDFNTYLDNVKKAAARLKMLCEIAHAAEQKDMKDRVEFLALELRNVSRKLEATRITESAQARHYASDLIDVWHDDVRDVEQELQLWKTVRFNSAMRDHWSQNGILPLIAEWRGLCESQNSIFWASSQNNGRQSWLTEFSINLIHLSRSQGQLVSFGMCDRPGGLKWTPKQLLKQLICQLLNDIPKLTVLDPAVFNLRSFRRATSFNSILKILHSAVGILGSVIIVIDRLDLSVCSSGHILG